MYELEKKVGQLFMVGLPGPCIDHSQKEILSRLGIGGIILFNHNYENVDQLVLLTNDVQKNAINKAWQGLPSWIAVDNEGGRVFRFGSPFSHFPSLKKWGDLNSPETCFEAGYVMAKELLACGVNVNLSPVIDVTQPNTSDVIGDRAFSSDRNIVGILGSATSRGLQKGGVVSVAKHFPGHGAVSVDSHQELPVCNKSMEEFDALDWHPFKKVIYSGAEGVMVAHISCPGIDANRITTFSRNVIRECLRTALQFSKLIFTDDLEMKAVTGKFSLSEAAFLAVEAGCDQLVFGHEFDQIEEVWSHLVNAFSSGVLPESRLDESLQRIISAKQRYLGSFKFADKLYAKTLLGNPEFRTVLDALNKGKAIDYGPSMADTS